MTTNRTSSARDSILASDQKMIAGIQKHQAALPTLMVGGVGVAPLDIVKMLQDRIALGKAVEPATAARAAAVKAFRDKRAATAGPVLGLKRAVRAIFADSPDTLADFGLTALKSGKASVKTKAAAVDKNKATRAARHTMGSVQRKSVTGARPAPSTSPAQAASAPAASPPPSPPAPAVPPKPVT
jgi:hypothetical protein